MFQYFTFPNVLLSFGLKTMTNSSVTVVSISCYRALSHCIGGDMNISELTVCSRCAANPTVPVFSCCRHYPHDADVLWWDELTRLWIQMLTGPDWCQPLCYRSKSKKNQLNLSCL